ncbi:uncharacterized protein LOC113202662 [Frankliniella occidentalis]|uniref:Uncharacterized protein LOC113202662 n=1 Tax=Frankliniella occidentalis TaxID=133901 RepID=A0A6J1S0R0_FRAOC|nr:uncharacterized protein LOC113202662 [Frankliniella occidentalis]XP_026272795.1 uncharacterized protein LOC113202662 [Frankliniella occidentalis]
MEPRAACSVLLAALLVAAAGANHLQEPSRGDVSHRRVRRQNGEVVESIFQIPIQTLMAVSKVFTTGIQSIRRTGEQFFQATRPTGTSSLTSSSAGSYGTALQQQYQQYQQQYQQYRPPKPYRPRPSAGTYSSSAHSSAYAALTRPNYNYIYSNYVYPRGGAASSSTGTSKSHAANVAGVGTQADGSSYRI